MDVKIVYTCPECGSDLIDLCLTSDPPQYVKKCFRCGWSGNEGRQKKREIIRIPWQKTDSFESFTVTSIPGACINCPNHPSNGGSGICHCTLGTPTITASSDVITSSDIIASSDGSWSIDIETENQN